MPRIIHGRRVRVRRTAPNFTFTGIEGAVGWALHQSFHHPVCGIYFNRAIRAHGAPIDKEFQLAGGRASR
jgi:hypothetical protein